MTPRFWLSGLALTLFLTVPTFANDLNPPDYRSELRSTRATWDFLSETNPQAIPPDANVWVGDAADALQDKFPNTVGYPAAATFGNVTYEPNLGGGYAGGPDGGGGLVFVLPNWFESSNIEITQLRLQVTYFGPEPPTTVVGYADIPGETLSIHEMRRIRVPLIDASQPAGSGYFYEDWDIQPSPVWEQVMVYVPEETVLLQVIIDTGIVMDPIFSNQYEPYPPYDPKSVSPWK